MMRRLWLVIRQLSGDDAYERYLVHHSKAHSGKPPLGRQEYFKQAQEQKWSGVRRCC